jgi:hypothetical protein
MTGGRTPLIKRWNGKSASRPRAKSTTTTRNRTLRSGTHCRAGETHSTRASPPPHPRCQCQLTSSWSCDSVVVFLQVDCIAQPKLKSLSATCCTSNQGDRYPGNDYFNNVSMHPARIKLMYCEGPVCKVHAPRTRCRCVKYCEAYLCARFSHLVGGAGSCDEPCHVIAGL